MSAELAFNRSVDVDYGVSQEVAPGIRRIVANNPGPYTFLGTNTYIVGNGQVAVIDPGPADERHLKAIAAATKGERLVHILITHSHHDHCDGARPLQALLGGEISAFGPTGTHKVIEVTVARTSGTEIERGQIAQRGQEELNQRARKAAVQTPGKGLTNMRMNNSTGNLVVQ